MPPAVAGYYAVLAVLLLRVNKCKLSQYTVRIFIKTDFPSLADEIAELRPDMNIKVAAFTVCLFVCLVLNDASTLVGH